MAFGKGRHLLPPFFWRQLLWKLAIIMLVSVIVAQMAFILVMSKQETQDAFSSGRRFIINLSDSSIQGKIISSEDLEKEITKSEENKQTEKTEPDNNVSENKIPDKEIAKTEEKPAEIETAQEVEKEIIKEETKENNIPENKEGEIINNLTVVYDDEKEEPLPPIVPSKNPPAEISDNLSEKTEFGTLPKISDKGLKPWKYYAKPFNVKDKKPTIAIIVYGLGNNKFINQQALRLPENISLSFSPYIDDLDNLLISARVSGHETMLDLPMESSNYPASDPGPLGLLLSKDQQENEFKIKKIMARNAGFIGFLTPQNEVILENNELSKSLLQVLSGRGLMLAIGKKPSKNETKEIIDSGNTASVIIDTVIDEELTQSSIRARFSLLEQIAKDRGYSVGIAKAYPLTVKELKEWIDKYEEKGFHLVPVSFIVAKRF